MRPRPHLLLLALLLPLLAVVPEGGGAPTSPPVRRLAGGDRVATAVEVSRATFGSADTAVVATAADYPDALSGSVLAASLDGPLLLTPPRAAPDALLAELDRLGVSRVVVLGGPAAVDEAVVGRLRRAGHRVSRIAGRNRFATSAEVAAEQPARTVVLATGRTFPDAVAASAYAASQGWPILLVDTHTVDPAVLDLLDEAGTERVVPVGGPVAIGDDVLAELRDRGLEVAPRLAGPTRWATSDAVVRAHRERLSDPPTTLWVATGESFPDALSAGTAAAASGALLQLSPTTTTDVAGSPADVRGVITGDRACEDGHLTSGTLVGGRAALARTVEDQLDALLTCEPLPVTVLAAGDIAGCEVSGDEATAALLDELPGTIAALGDLAYDSGTAAEFARCYDPSWGRHRDRTRPAIGNHDIVTDRGGPYYDYFGPRAGPAGRGYHGFDLSDQWHAVVLNSNCWAVGGCGPGSPQHDWLLDELRAHRDQHVVAWMHHPRWSSGHHGSNAFVQPLFAALADHGVDVVLAGHDHHYERFAPLGANGRPDPDGTMSFVIGTGGRVLYALGDRAPHSQVVSNDSFGVLELTLWPRGYAWRFVPTEDGATSDHGNRRLGAPET